MPALQDNNATPRVSSTLIFDWLMLIGTTAFLGGLLNDPWASNDLKENFFSPYGAAMYGGLALVVLTTAWTIRANMRDGRSLKEAIPAGYDPTVAGVVAFALVGFGLILEHIGHVTGHPIVLTNSINPVYVLGAIGIGLILSGPVRAAWARPGRIIGWKHAAPMLIATAFVLTVATSLTLYDTSAYAPNPGPTTWYRLPRDVNGVLESLAWTASVRYVLIRAVIIAAFVLTLLRRFDLPFGSFALIFGLNAAFSGPLNPQFPYWRIEVTIAAFLIVDVLCAFVRPTPQRLSAFRTIGFFAPFIYFAIYLSAMPPEASFHSFLHQVDMGFGGPLYAGIAGLLLSTLATPARYEERP